MNKQIETIKQARYILLKRLNSLSNEQLNQTPQGLNNNIIWNLGHMIAVQQAVCYQRSGLPLLISNDFWGRFKPDSKPEEIVSNREIDHIKQILLTTADEFETDYNSHMFSNYTAWSSRLGIELTTIDDALNFLQFHEGLHAGAILAIKGVVTQ